MPEAPGEFRGIRPGRKRREAQRRVIQRTRFALEWIDGPCRSRVALASGNEAVFRSMQDHRKLLIWKRSHTLAIETRRVLRRFPRSGFGGLRTQITEAAESIVFNIVEGCGADTAKEFSRFLGMSIKSTTEYEGQMELARDYGVLSAADCRRLVQEATEIRKMTYGLRAYLRDREKDEGEHE